MTDTSSQLSRETLDLLIRRLKKQPAEAAGDRIPRRPEGAPSPVASGQERLWFLHQLDPASPAYNLTAAVHLPGEPDARAVDAALAALVRRHQSLRTVVRPAEPVPELRVLAPEAVPPPATIDLRGIPGARARREAARLAAREAGRPFDLASGPLLRLTWVRLPEEDGVPDRRDLLISVHHVVADGWSIGVFNRELQEIAAALAAGRPPALPELPISFADYAAWQREQLASGAWDDQIDYWRNRLAGAAGTRLLGDRPLPATASERGVALAVVVPRDVIDAVEAVGREERATPFMVLLAGYQALVARLTGDDDVTLGSVVAGRDRPEVQGLIGFLANTLVLRDRVDSQASFREAVACARATAVEALRHQELPFSEVAEAARSEPGAEGSRLIHLLFSMETRPGRGLALPGAAGQALDAELEEVASGTAKFDLTVNLQRRDDGIRGSVEASLDRFDPTTLVRLWRRYLLLLRSALAAPGRALADLPLLSEVERRQLVVEWNDSAAVVPAASLWEMVVRQVAERPDAVAVSAPARQLSYAGLCAEARAIAHAVGALGLPAEAAVGVGLEPGPASVSAFLGVLAAGAVYVPLDPRYPSARLAQLAGEAGLDVLLTRRTVASAFADVDRPATLYLEDVPRVAPLGAGIAGAGAAGPDRLAYVIFTSGSSCVPKGVEVTHRALANLALHQATAFELAPGDRMARFAPLSFDASISELAAPLAAGASLVFGDTLPGAPLARLIDRERVTVLKLPPSSLALMPGGDAGTHPSLRILAVAGEPCAPDLVERWGAGRRMMNVYGPTETTVTALVGPLAPGEPVALGMPLRNTRTYVVDAALRPVPAGVPGELCVAGAGVARGYRGRRSATARAFVPDPFAPFADEPGARMYRTGDLACRLADGRLLFLGRRDRQVKVRGFRVEPAEVEAALRALDGVVEAAVVARRDAGGDARLLAWVAGQPAGDLSGQRLRATLARRLPAHLVPTSVTVVEALPRTPAGKVDYGALDAGRSRPRAAGEEPRTSTERSLATAFSDLLGKAEVGRHDDFFELGGHSLSAVRLSARVRSRFGVDLPVRRIFEERTIAALAAVIDRAEAPAAGEADAIAGGGPVPAETEHLVSFSQEQLWFLNRLDPASSRYNLAVAVDLDGDLRPAALARAIAGVVARHPSLRTRFATRDGAPVQIVHPPARQPIPVIDLSVLPPARAEAAADSLARAGARRPFDLAAGPLLRVTLLRLGGDRHRLVVAMHHIVSDGWSSAIFLREFAALYRAAVTGERADLPALAIDYPAYARWQRGAADSAETRESLAFWRRMLAGAEPPELPVDRLPGARRTGRGGILAPRIEGRVVERLRALAGEERVTLFAVVLAGLAAVVTRLTGQKELIFAVPLANRGRPGVAGVIGFFVNTLPVRVDLRGDPRFGELVRRMAETLVAAQEHQEVPLEHLLNDLRTESDGLFHRPRFLRFTLAVNPPSTGLELPELAARLVPLYSGDAKLPLTLALEDRGEALGGYLEYAEDLFDRTSAERFLHRFERFLGAVAARPERRIGEFALLSAAERQQTVVEWQGRVSAPSRTATLHALVGEHAAACPDAIALAYGRTTVSYGELDRRARRLAGELGALGVEAGDVVAVCLERTAEQIVAFVAVLVAGGCYLPLDPSHPPARLAGMVEDSGARLVLTRSAVARATELDRPERAAWRNLLLDQEMLAAGRTGGASYGPESPAYLIYTSGSTGRPKGVVMPHAAIVRLACDPGWPRAHREDRVAQVANVSFDASALEIWSALANGACLVGIERETTLDPRSLSADLSRRRVTFAVIPTALFNGAAQRGTAPFDTMRVLLVGGEALNPAAVARVIEAGPPGALGNAYGPTEAAVVAAWHPTSLAPSQVGSRQPIPIGRPMPGVTAHVTDRELRPLPIGMPGELVLGGAGLAHGYLGRSAVTAGRFVPDPFGEPGARLYRTGDLVRRLPDGVLDFLGRFDHQVKIRGVRIELGEVEAALAARPEVGEVVVVAREDAPGDRQLVAYVTPREGWALDVEALRAGLARELPAAMVPAAFVPLERLPVNPQGKVDRSKLPAPAPSARPGGGLGRPAEGTLERTIAACFAAELRIEEVGADDDFFMLGGHSLRATEVMWRLGRELGVEVPLGTLFAHPTVAGLARAIAGQGIDLDGVEKALAALPGVDRAVVVAVGEGGSRRLVGCVTAADGAIDPAGLRRALRDLVPPAAVPSAIAVLAELPSTSAGEPDRAALAAQAAQALSGARVVQAPPAPRRRVFPLSYSQRRLWFLDRLDPGSAVYAIAGAFAVHGPVRLPVLAAALSAVVARHEALRTVFRDGADDPVQEVRPATAIPLPVVDLAGLPSPIHRAVRDRLAEALARRPFDLATGPLLRVLAIRLAPDEQALVVAMHHIVSDGWSVGVFVRELMALYQAFAAGEGSPLPPLRLQYGDFALTQRARLRGPALDRDLAFWSGRLADLPALELPANRPRPARRSGRGGRVRTRLDTDLGAALSGLARASRATPFMVLLAAFQAVLGRWSRQHAFAVGTPLANRIQGETEGLIGFFVNTLVLRADLAGAPSFAELLARVRGEALDAFGHQELPFERLVEEVAPRRELNHQPLFQVMLAFQNAPTTDLALAGLEIAPIPLESGTAKFDLLLDLGTVDGAVEGTLEYDADLFDRATAARLVDHFLTLLGAAIAAPDRTLDQLPLLPPAERHQIVHEWAGRESSYPRERGVGELFAEVAARRPDAVAVAGTDGVLTYAELAARSRRLAGELRRRGVGPEVAVGMLLERSLELVVATLAVIEAGGYYAPLDPAYPAERLRTMLADAGAPVVLTSPALRGHLRDLTAGGASGWRGEVMVLAPGAGGRSTGTGDRRPAASAASAASGLADPRSLAYVMYTSGSTGRPKGVAVPHRAIVRLVREADFADLGADQTFLQLAPTAFDAATLEIWGALLNGGRLELMAPGPIDLVELGATVVARRVTTLWLTAGLFHRMVEERMDDLAGVRQLLSGGDVLSPAHVARAVAALEPGGMVINGYGPTENTTFTSYHPLRAGPAVEAPVPIGRPIADGAVLILDRALAPAPVGVPGELCAAGDGLARGYLGRPARTAVSFTPHPFPRRAGERVYRTGDLARWLPDGTIDFLGRQDDQVKIRGFRIEPGEIESILAKHPAVGQALVVVGEDAAGQKRLVAYVAAGNAEDGGAVEEGELRAHLGARLPSYMVPAAIVVLERFPLTANGKIDRRALPAPEDGEPVATAERDAPRTPAEALIAAAFAEVLGRAAVGRDDDFFSLGGHSLLATRVISRLRRALAVEIPLRTLFEAPTVAALAERVGALAESAAPAIVPLPAAERRAGVPASFAQQRLWFLDRLEPGSAVYNIPVRLTLKGEVDLPALTRAIRGIARRQEALRTVFAERDGLPLQVVLPLAASGAAHLPVVDLAALPSGRAAFEAERLAGDEARRPFDLAQGPLLRARYLRHGAGQAAIVLVFHHVIADGWSLGVFFRELSTAYRGEELPELPIQYGDFAVWQRGWLAGDVLAAQVAYWRERLAGVPVLELPADRRRPAGRARRGGAVPLALGEAFSARVAEVGRRVEATPFMVLLAAYQALLARASGERDFAVGSPIASRTRKETEGLIGFFVNTLVLRADLSGDPTFDDAIARVRESALGAYAHQDVPFEKLVEDLAPDRRLDDTPLFQAFFTLQNAELAAPALPGVAVTGEALDSGAAKFDLSLGLAEIDGRLVGALEHDREIFDPPTVARLARRFEALLDAALADPGRALAALPAMPPAERQQVIREWAGGAPPAGAGRGTELLHRRFEEQAARSPDAVALVTRGETWSYAALERRSAALARRLRALGVGRSAGEETLVAVALERAAELVVALLAVLRAGGAYVPIDPAYPEERRAFMLADSGARVLVAGTGSAPARRDGLVVVEVGPAPEEGGAPAVAGGREPRPERLPAVDPAALAYVIYTSGSTGRPKGVAIAHRNAAALLDWAETVFSPAELAAVAATTSVCFDLSIFELFLPLATGGRVVLADDALALVDFAGADRLTLVNTVPSAATELVRLRAVPPSLLTLNLAGEPLKGSLVRQIYAGSGVGRVLNLYGPSEDTTYSTYAVAAKDAAGEPTIGRAVAGSRAYLLDGGGRAVPAGSSGELYLGGAGVSRGYLGRPGQTAARYVPDPFAAETGGAPGARLYRTGDLARFLPDGELVFLGRIDHQVKVRGFRIELGEIEAALAAHPAVAACAVVVRGEGSDARLVAFVEPREEEGADADALAEHLRARLPPAMVPAAFAILAALPLTPNGKIDRRALAGGGAGLEVAGAARQGEYVAPRGPVEETLAAIWADLLDVDRVGVADDFFALGGHSLKATQVVSRVREALDVDLPLRRLFEAPTVAGLAAAIAVMSAAGGPLSALAAGPAAPPPLVPQPRGDTSPLSYSQERLWILERFEPGTAAYNVPVAARLTGILDVPALAGALGRVIARHEALRTVFSSHDGRPVQRVLGVGERAAGALPVIDLSRLPAPARQAALTAVNTQTGTAPFDLTQGPLLRTVLVRESPDRHVLQATFHHIVSDGWSLGIFLRELSILYRSRVAPGVRVVGGAPGSALALPEPPIQYADFALWQRAWLAGGEREAQLAYWRGRLEPAPPGLELPLDRPRPAVRTYSSGRIGRRLPAELVGRLREIGRARGASLFMVLLAGLDLLVSRLAGEEDVAVGSPVAGRGRQETEGLIGMFLNTLVLRTDVGAAAGFGELVERVRDTCLDAYAHQDVPFEMLLDALNPGRDLSRTPLFQVFFNMLELPIDERTDLAGVELELLEPPELPSKFDLTLYAQPQGEEVSYQLVYNADLFDAATAARFLAQLEVVLAGAAAAPEAPLANLSPMTAEEEALVPDPREALDGSWHGAVSDRLSRQARERPDAVAVSDPQRTWTYGELEQRTNRLAHRLVAAGVERGDRVAIYAQRDAALVEAVYAVLKAGGAFVILDPAYPPRRHVDVLELAAPRAWIALAAAGEPAPELGSYLAMLEDCPRIVLGAEGSASPADQTAPPPVAAEGSESPPAVALGPDDLAYVAFTSGSTGQPKGILGRHGPLSHFLPWQRERFRLGPGDRFSMLSGLAHDPLQRDLFTPVWMGAALVVPDPLEMAGAGRLAAWMARERITVAHLTPAMGQVMTEHAGLAQGVAAAPVRAEALRWVLLVGDVLTVRDVERLRTLAPGVACINLFGSTETQRAVAYHRVPDEVGRPGSRIDRAREVLPLGRGMPDVQLLVLAPGDRVCAVGEVGELCIRSPHLSLGYLGDPELTAARFVANPFTGVPNDRVYRTGDLGRYLPDGAAVYLGRADQQIKIRGYRIEPGEIQANVTKMPGVREAVVLAKDGGPGGKQLVAYVEADPAGPRPTPETLRGFLRERLPAYMVPAGFAVLDEIPLTPNGKVDRRALAQLEDSSREVNVDSRPPRTEAEKTVAAIVRDVLGLERIGADDNFFDLGGNSLLLVQVHGRLETTFERAIPMVELFNHPTVGALAEHLAPDEEAEDGEPSEDARDLAREDEIKKGRNRLKRRRARMKG